MAAQLASNIPDVEKLQIAAYAPRVTSGWSTDDKLIDAAILRASPQRWKAATASAGTSKRLPAISSPRSSLAERRQVLAAGENFPTSALSVLAKLPANPGRKCWREIRALDQRLGRQAGRADRPPARRHHRGARAKRRARIAGLLARGLYERSRSPCAGRDEPHTASRRRELDDPGRFAADDRRHASAGCAGRVDEGQSPAGNVRAVSQRDSRRPANAEHGRRRGRETARTLDESAIDATERPGG